MRLPLPDRRAAGRALAARLGRYAGRDDVLVLALPRGGVPVAFEIATTLGLPLDLLTVRKLGVPGHEELAMGAIASGGARVFNRSLIDTLGVTPAQIEAAMARERRELERRERDYRGERPRPEVHGRTVLLVDDGVATGATMRAAVAALKALEPAAVVVAVPTASREARDVLLPQVDELVCLALPEPYIAVGAWYQTFGQTSDDEVRRLLARAVRPAQPHDGGH
ncbi:MAG: phosphoribosyltransferase [Planctomycetota bacterium]